MAPASDTIAGWVDGTTAAWSEFTPTSGTIRSLRVMGNFGVFRGHICPLDPTTTAFVSDTYDLGSGTYRWRNIFGTLVGKVSPSSVSTTGSMTINTWNDVVLMNSTAGTITATLPTHVGNTGTVLTIKNIGTGSKTVVIAATGGQNIESTTASYEIVDMQSVTLLANNGWWLI